MYVSLTIIAKNVVLAGVKSVTIYDPDTIQQSHLSSQVMRSYIIIYNLYCSSFLLKKILERTVQMYVNHVYLN